MMEKSSVWILIVDGLCLAVVGIPILVIKYAVKPTQLGFYCSDRSLHYPYHSSTVPTSLNLALSYGVPIVLVVARHATRRLQGQTSTRAAVRQGYTDLIIFLFGVFTVQMVSGLCKVTAGRLRPHFMSVCQPNLTDSSCGRWERPQYVTNFTCSGNLQLFPEPAEREQRLAEARLSFLSGHASLSWYGGVFSAGYIQTSATRHRNVSCLPLVLVQVAVTLYAMLVSISRVTDNKHHPSDVLAGALLGVSLALMSLYRVRVSECRREYTSVHSSQSAATTEEMSTKIS